MKGSWDQSIKVLKVQGITGSRCEGVKVKGGMTMGSRDHVVKVSRGLGMKRPWGQGVMGSVVTEIRGQRIKGSRD